MGDHFTDFEDYLKSAPPMYDPSSEQGTPEKNPRPIPIMMKIAVNTAIRRVANRTFFNLTPRGTKNKDSVARSAYFEELRKSKFNVSPPGKLNDKVSKKIVLVQVFVIHLRAWSRLLSPLGVCSLRDHSNCQELKRHVATI